MALPTDSTTGAALITPQLGLLEDDIAYRLALLCVNVLQPLKDKFPNVIVTSGFRQTNTGIGQHELGEAVDLQIRNQTPELLYIVADYIQKSLPFDQLILNYTTIGAGDPWIHVSFSPTSLRGQVLTKDFADTFHEGLFLVEPLSGEAAAAALRTQAEQDAAITLELQNLTTRADRLTPKAVVEDSGVGGPGEDLGPGSHGDQSALVQCVYDAINKVLPVNNWGAAFEVTKRVAWLLAGDGCGLHIVGEGADDIVHVGDYPIRTKRVIFLDGEIYKIISGGFGPMWNHDGVQDASKYLPAIDPGTDLTLEWQTCSTGGPAANTV